MGPNIQGNRENLKAPKFFIFDVQALDTGDFLTANERAGLMIALGAKGVDMQIVQHVPVLHQDVTLQELGLTSVGDLLAFAEGPSLVHQIREGLVFKRMDGKFSFKAISNQFLAKEKD
jgi:ATP-dependent RNA circularization protein (DNA/RNA ligase family)